MTKEITVDGRTFRVAPIRVGQMRDMAMVRQNEPNRSAIEDNIDTVVYCLQNGGMQISRTEVEDLPWTTYRQLVDLSSDISGFNMKDLKPGEEVQVAP